ncbi:hypothetical protein TNCV_1121841 [Trichonephila clavipes]|nr:hypothetical protein TNCV_1121841 [Trichonephila clavipes]
MPCIKIPSGSYFRYERPISNTVVTHVGAPVVWGLRIIDTSDKATATALEKAQRVLLISQNEFAEWRSVGFRSLSILIISQE